jgi:Rrf2 family cysteine metabolism transcriptional repressor
VQLTRLSEDLPVELFGKLESFNLRGSIKKRVGVAMISYARAGGPDRAWARDDRGGDQRRARLDVPLYDRDVLSITSKSPYAVRALVELHRLGDSCPVPIGELARRGDIPVQFLEQLFATLRRAGLLRSQRGVKGGYSFARPPGQITVLEVVELLDGPLGHEATGIFAEAAEAARVILAGSTIADVAEAEARAAGAAMYHI